MCLGWSSVLEREVCFKYQEVSLSSAQDSLIRLAAHFRFIGNNYSFVNEHDKPAAIFFTQGCIPLDAEGKVDTGAPAPPLPDPVLQQQQIELEQSQIQEEQQQQEGEQELTQPPQKESKGKPGKKKKGRPKQKA